MNVTAALGAANTGHHRFIRSSLAVRPFSSSVRTIGVAIVTPVVQVNRFVRYAHSLSILCVSITNKSSSARAMKMVNSYQNR